MDLKTKSWKEELDDEYAFILEHGTIEDLDKANEIICKTIRLLQTVRKTSKLINKIRGDINEKKGK